MGETNEDEIINFLWRSNQIEEEHSLRGLSAAIHSWETALYTQNGETLHWDIGDILYVHEDLLANINPRIAGKLTTVQTTVGGRDNPAPQFIEELLEEWCETFGDAKAEKVKVISRGTKDSAIQNCMGNWIREAHIAFEKIHPFEDGNGRVGRIIMNQQRLAVGLPILTVWPDGEWQNKVRGSLVMKSGEPEVWRECEDEGVKGLVSDGWVLEGGWDNNIPQKDYYKWF